MKGHEKILDVPCEVALRGRVHVVVQPTDREKLERQRVTTLELVIVGELAEELAEFRVQIWRKK